jgi:hypothetical protein
MHRKAIIATKTTKNAPTNMAFKFSIRFGFFSAASWSFLCTFFFEEVVFSIYSSSLKPKNSMIISINSGGTTLKLAKLKRLYKNSLHTGLKEMSMTTMKEMSWITLIV